MRSRTQVTVNTNGIKTDAQWGSWVQYIPIPVSGVPSRHKDGAPGTGLHLYTRMLVTRIEDPQHFNADPDLETALHLNADLYSTFHFNANTDFALIEVMQICNHWPTESVVQTL
jgi:hypothetical protein